MRIVQVAPFYKPVIGGVENVVDHISRYCVSKGHEVFVVTYDRARKGSSKHLVSREEDNGLTIIRLPVDIKWNQGSYSSKMKDCLRNIKPDIVHVHNWRHPHVFQVAKLKDEMHFKAILHGHAPYHSEGQLGAVVWLYHRTVDILSKATLKKYDRLISLTDYEKEKLLHFGVPPDKIVIIPNGIDETFEEIDEYNTNGGRNVLYMGAISSLKNMDLLKKSMSYVFSRMPDSRLLLAGEDQGALRRLLTGEIGSRTEYFGVVRDPIRLQVYGKSRVFVHPTIYEAYGISLIEAQRFGKPCVITGKGGQTYAAPPDQTSLLAKETPEDFGAKIISLLLDEDLYSRLSANATRWGIQHLWKNVLPRYDQLYESVLTN